MTWPSGGDSSRRAGADSALVGSVIVDEQRDSGEDFFVQDSHVPPGLVDIPSDRRNSTLHLTSKLQNLRFDSGHSRRQFPESLHLLLQNLDAFGQWASGHAMSSTEEVCDQDAALQRTVRRTTIPSSGRR